VQDVRAQGDEAVVERLQGWIRMQHERPGTSSDKVPVALVYADGIHNMDMHAAFTRVETAARKGRGHCATLHTQQLNSKSGLSKAAADIWKQVLPDTAPGPVCTLRGLAAALQESGGERRRTAGVLICLATLCCGHCTHSCSAAQGLGPARCLLSA
jgi:hypothetical protein